MYRYQHNLPRVVFSWFQAFFWSRTLRSHLVLGSRAACSEHFLLLCVLPLRPPPPDPCFSPEPPSRISGLSFGPLPLQKWKVGFFFFFSSTAFFETADFASSRRKIFDVEAFHFLANHPRFRLFSLTLFQVFFRAAISGSLLCLQSYVPRCPLP